MITSDKSIEASKKQQAMLQDALNAPVEENIPEIVRNASRAQIQSLIREIQKEAGLNNSD